MADNITYDISKALYGYLCQNIVGTEDYVKQLRLTNAARDNLSSDQKKTVITSGSFGEGLEMRGSDLDLTFIDKTVAVFYDVKPYFNENITYFSLEIDDVKPGYAKLQLQHNNGQYDLKKCVKLKGKYYLSSALHKQQHLKIENTTIHGPSNSVGDGFIDNVFGFHCKQWISPAYHWITRSRNSWPDYDVKQSIFNHGVICVPVGDKGSPKEDIQWRISFSVAERLLINIFTHTQLLCYVLFKILLKDVIATNSGCNDLLCSYFLKTIIFWISEELPHSFWKPDNLIPCFMRCFRRLIYCVKFSVCVHYFIPENNMFEKKIEGYARKTLLETLNSLYSYRWQSILFSDQIYKVHLSLRNNSLIDTWNIHTDLVIMHIHRVAKSLDSNILPIANASITNSKLVNMLKRGIQETISCNQVSIKFRYIYFMSMWCASRSQSIPLNNRCIDNKCRYKQHKTRLSTLLYIDNKCRYEQHKTRLFTLLLNIHHDAVSGWLLLGSAFYKRKQYSKALQIINHCISKFTSEKLYHFIAMSNVHLELLKLPSFKKIGIAHLWKILFVDTIIFETNSELIPDEQLIGGRNVQQCIPSIPYAYFLQLLCHYHLKMFEQCEDSFINLLKVASKNYYKTDPDVTFAACNILRIATVLLSKTQSAHIFEILKN